MLLCWDSPSTQNPFSSDFSHLIGKKFNTLWVDFSKACADWGNSQSTTDPNMEVIGRVDTLGFFPERNSCGVFELPVSVLVLWQRD